MKDTALWTTNAERKTIKEAAHEFAQSQAQTLSAWQFNAVTGGAFRLVSQNYAIFYRKKQHLLSKPQYAVVAIQEPVEPLLVSLEQELQRQANADWVQMIPLPTRERRRALDDMLWANGWIQSARMQGVETTSAFLIAKYPGGLGAELAERLRERLTR